MRRRRTLTGDEQALWTHVTRHVSPLAGRRPRIEPEAAAPPPAPVTPDPPAKAAKAAKTVPAKPLPPPAPPPIPPLAPIERRLKQRLSRGSQPIDAVIDLHGMRQAEAHHALHSFILRHHAQGSRVVLVVTGKGSRIGEAGEAGVLRRAAPHWLASADWRTMIVGFEQAGRGHGGDGALYVHLRRRRED